MTQTVMDHDETVRRNTPSAIYRRLEDIEESIVALKDDVSRMGTGDHARLMGVTEVAEALGVSTSLVSTWLARGKMPEPIARLKATPVWTEAQIEVMLRLKREG